jgi:uncharacterized protein (DUF4415 family)
MNANKLASKVEWIDPDDAPELTDEFFDNATWSIGDRIVSMEEGRSAMKEALRRGRPKAVSPKLALTVRYDAEIVEAFKSTGKGWQTRMNEALKEWLKDHATTTHTPSSDKPASG